MAATRAIGVGAGGHAKVVLDALLGSPGLEIVGLLDPRRELWGVRILGVLVLGDDALMEGLFRDGVRHAFLGLGGAGDNGPRRRLYERVRSLGFEMAAVVHPRAVVSPAARIGRGPAILAGAVVNPGAEIADNVIVNTGAIVEHDCVIGDHVHVAPGARLGGGVVVEAGAHVGLGASVLPGIRIGAGAIVGAGAAVVRDVAEGAVVAGVPARVLRMQTDGNSAQRQ